MTLIDDVRRAMKQIADQPVLGPTATLHHPKCPAVEHNDITKCTCGGLELPVRLST